MLVLSPDSHQPCFHLFEPAVLYAPFLVPNSRQTTVGPGYDRKEGVCTCSTTSLLEDIQSVCEQTSVSCTLSCHLVVHIKSAKRETILRENFKPWLLSHLHKAGQSQWDTGVNVGFYRFRKVTEIVKHSPPNTSVGELCKEWVFRSSDKLL